MGKKRRQKVEVTEVKSSRAPLNRSAGAEKRRIPGIPAFGSFFLFFFPKSFFLNKNKQKQDGTFKKCVRFREKRNLAFLYLK